MANECRGRWENFELFYDKAPTEKVERGFLEIDDHTGDTIRGRQKVPHSPPSQSPDFNGHCRNGPNATRVISFPLIMDGGLFFFRGTIQGNPGNRVITGMFFVVARVSMPETTVAAPPPPTPEPGDTGTWGGSQGL